jgi:hypothetical protein
MSESPLYDYLSTSNSSARLSSTQGIFDRMQAGDISANQVYGRLCFTVVRKLRAQGVDDPDVEPTDGIFKAGASARLVHGGDRVRGFLRAIARAPQAETIIDAGTGSSALLAIGAALSHPKAEVIAYEANPYAARCAAEIVRICGLADRINVESANVLDPAVGLPDVDLAVTETFGSALLYEPGPQIAARLAQHAEEILPASATVSAIDYIADNAVWGEAATVDFSAPGAVVNGTFLGQVPGLRSIYARTGYFDARGESVLDTTASDALTLPAHLGTVHVPSPGVQIEFSYRSGSHALREPTVFNVASPGPDYTQAVAITNLPLIGNFNYR